MSTPEEVNHPETEQTIEPFEEYYSICSICKSEESMYPHRFKDDDNECNTLCADCYWDEDERRKHERRLYFANHPEEYEAFRRQAAETLGVKYVPLPKEWYASIIAAQVEEDKKNKDQETQSDSK